MLFMYIYLFLFFQSTLFLKKEDKKKKSIKNITKVVEICDKTVLEPFGIFQKKGSLPRRELLVEKLLGRRPPEFLLWTQQRNLTSIKIVLLLFLCSYQRAAPNSSGLAAGSTQV